MAHTVLTGIVRGPQWPSASQTLPTITVKSDRCTGCGLCVPFCKPDVLRVGSEINQFGDHQVEIYRAGCTGCKMCAIVCPDLAIEVFVDVTRKRAGAVEAG